MVQVEVLDWSRAGRSAKEVRLEVFCIEQGIDPALEMDDNDASSLHALARDDNGAVLGTGRLRRDGHIGRMAVRKSARGKGVGRRILDALVEQGRLLGMRQLALDAQLSAVPFYQSAGFEPQGEVFTQVGIEHRSMHLNLAVADENLWLEEIDGQKAMDWVKSENARSAALLEGDPRFATFKARLTSIYESTDRIPVATVRGDWLYNFWQDATHVRGIWRRTTLASYRLANPEWQLLLDLDLLAASEGEAWVWGGAQACYPAYRRALVRLSKGGGDATVTREFDLQQLAFVADGFVVPHGKSQVSWIDENQLFVCAECGEGSMTASGYPRIARRWQRGTPLSEAVVEFEAQHADVQVRAYATRDWHDGVLKERQWLMRHITFQTFQTLLLVDGKAVEIAVPDDADVSTFGDQLLVTLKSDWQLNDQCWPQGSLLAIALDQFLAGSRDFTLLYQQAERRVLAGMFNTRTRLYLTQMDNLVQKIEALTFDQGVWQRTPVATDASVMTEMFAYEADVSDDVWVAESGPLFPTRLGLLRACDLHATILKSPPPLFDASGLEVLRLDALSKDGTAVPYVVVQQQGASPAAPTLLSGYGGFEIARLPLPYNAVVGAAWLEAGGRYVVAGIRGGGEFGPAWHLAAIREKKQNCFDDFMAVAADLAARKLSEPAHLGIQGGSNGGLLVGAVMTQAPELFGAVLCQVPLLDMRRYHKLLAGASWVAEYGDPDAAADWAFIERYSPYQQVKSTASYPPVLFATSTRDDRVHPGHARKMAARMQAMGHDVLYYENIEGGHAGAANQRQAAHLSALAYSFLWQKLA
jgi:prolyl oligopeptidase